MGEEPHLTAQDFIQEGPLMVLREPFGVSGSKDGQPHVKQALYPLKLSSQTVLGPPNVIFFIIIFIISDNILLNFAGPLVLLGPGLRRLP